MDKEKKTQSTVAVLNDDTIGLLDEQYEFPDGCLKVGPLRTPIRVEKGVFQNISELEILPGTESFNIGRILLGCAGLKVFNIGNMEKDSIARIFARSGCKNMIWNNLTSLEIQLTNPTPSFSNTVGTVKFKRFPCLIELKYTCSVPHRAKLDSYIESYIDIHQFIVTNKKSLRKIMMHHELVFDVTSPALGFYCTEAKYHLHLESKSRILNKLKEALALLKLEAISFKFSPMESPLEWLKPRADLDLVILKSIKNLTMADLDWSNTSFWTDKEKDFTSFTENNGKTLLKLRVRMAFGKDGSFDCSLLQKCFRLTNLAIEGVWCKVKNVQFIPTSVKVMELRLPIKPAQKTWISDNLKQLEMLTIEQNFQGDDPLLSLFRLPKLKTLTVIYCTMKRAEELNLFCFNHAGLVLYEREDIPLKYFSIPKAYVDVTITIDHSKYNHKRQFEQEETGNIRRTERESTFCKMEKI